MPKRMLGPFAELQSLETVPAGSDGALLERMQLLHDVLEAAGCHCNGHRDGSERDSDWGSDISELIARCGPHDVYGLDLEGNRTVSQVSIKLDTLRVEIDADNEICAWLYEETINTRTR